MEVVTVPPPSGEILTIPEFQEKIKNLEFYGVHSRSHQELPSDVRLVWMIDGNGKYLPETYKVKGSIHAVQSVWRAYMKTA